MNNSLMDRGPDRRRFMRSSEAATCLGALPAWAALVEETTRSNILALVTDEHSAGIASAWIDSESIKTPNPDFLIASGT